MKLICILLLTFAYGLADTMSEKLDKSNAENSCQIIYNTTMPSGTEQLLYNADINTKTKVIKDRYYVFTQINHRNDYFFGCLFQKINLHLKMMEFGVYKNKKNEPVLVFDITKLLSSGY